MLHVRVEAGDVLYLPPFWLHRAECSSAACASTNVWVASRAMHRMEAIEAMPLPFEASWAPPTRYAAVLAFLETLLRAVHAEALARVEAVCSGRPWRMGLPARGRQSSAQAAKVQECASRALVCGKGKAKEEVEREERVEVGAGKPLGKEVRLAQAAARAP